MLHFLIQHDVYLQSHACKRNLTQLTQVCNTDRTYFRENLVSFCGTGVVTAGTRDDRTLINIGNLHGKNHHTLLICSLSLYLSSNNQKWLPTLIAHKDKLDHKL